MFVFIGKSAFSKSRMPICLSLSLALKLQQLVDSLINLKDPEGILIVD